VGDRNHSDTLVGPGGRGRVRALLPALRAEPPGTVVLADGFSCRTQIEQLAGRPALHLAELLRQALPPRDQRASLP
jgi:hypothetical protein